MNFTFGIITNGSNDHYIQQIVASIINENIPDYEIIIIGATSISGSNIINIPFDESIKPGWITKKKNLITQNAKYENIVYMHDYVCLCDGWYSGWLKFGNNFKIGMNKIIDYNGIRYRDWTLWPHNNNEMDEVTKLQPDGSREALLPYDVTNLSKYMYISGSYWVAKKEVMLEFPLNEELCWAESEDVDFSKRIRGKYDFSINVDSTVRLLKDGKHRAFSEISDVNVLKQF